MAPSVAAKEIVGTDGVAVKRGLIGCEPNQASSRRVGQPIFCWRSTSRRSSLARR